MFIDRSVLAELEPRYSLIEAAPWRWIAAIGLLFVLAAVAAL
jgi:hypothetical protein